MSKSTPPEVETRARDSAFWSKVDRRSEDECWEWQGWRGQRSGVLFYGEFWFNGVRHRAHRLAYELERGPIPEGLHIDHLCRNKGCVNPNHLEAVTLVENVMRGDGLAATNARRTHCSKGHEYTPENTYRCKRGYRDCRACRQIRKRAFTKDSRLARAALGELGWAPIETAPRSQAVLVFIPAANQAVKPAPIPFVVAYQTDHGAPPEKAWRHAAGACFGQCCGLPTHWMPLPKSPQANDG